MPERPHHAITPSLQKPSRLAVFILLGAIVGVFLFVAHARRLHSPVPITMGDQESYLRYARRMAESNYSYVGGRNRMPIYPFLLSLLYRPGMSEAEFLKRAQAFNVNLSAAVLVALFFLLRRYFPALFALALVAGVAFGVLIVRAPAVQVEVLFYFSFFCLFLAFCRLLVRPSRLFAALTGALAGITFLLKASVLPALALVSVIFLAKAIWERRACFWREAISVALLLAAFLVVVGPYIRNSKRVYGQYFYNVNSTFYFWTDSWPEARAFSKRSGDTDHWPSLPAEEIPSASKYWREHSLGQIAGRLLGGMAELATHNARLDGYYKYVLLLVGTALVLALRSRAVFIEWVKRRAFLSVFVLLFFLAYFCLFAWYTRLSAESRFLLTIFLPVIFAAAYVIVRFGSAKPRLLPILTAVLFFFATSDAIHRLVQLHLKDRGSDRAAFAP